MFWRNKGAKNKDSVAKDAESQQGDDESVNILRFLQESCMCMELQFQPSEIPDDENENAARKNV